MDLYKNIALLAFMEEYTETDCTIAMHLTTLLVVTVILAFNLACLCMHILNRNLARSQLDFVLCRVYFFYTPCLRACVHKFAGKLSQTIIACQF